MLFLIDGLVVHSFVSLNTTVLHYMKGKIISPLPFDVLYWDPHNEREMNWRKTIGGLIYAMHLCILERYLGKLNHFLKWCKFSSVQSLSQDQLFTTPWTAAHQASLSITNSQSWLKLMSTESLMPSNYLIFCRPLLLPPIFLSIRVLSNESVLPIRWQCVGDSALASVLPMNTQDWFPLGWTGWISLQSKGLSTVFSNTTV